MKLVIVVEQTINIGVGTENRTPALLTRISLPLITCLASTVVAFLAARLRVHLQGAGRCKSIRDTSSTICSYSQSPNRIQVDNAATAVQFPLFHLVLILAQSRSVSKIHDLGGSGKIGDWIASLGC